MSTLLAIICFIVDFILQLARVANLPVLLQPQCLIPLGLTFLALHVAGIWVWIPWRGPMR